MKTQRGLASAFIAILLTIGLLTVVRVSASPATPTGELVTITQTTVADFNQGNFYLTGMTRNDNGEVTLLQLGIAGEWLTATNSTGFVPRYEHASIAYDNRLYVFGGRTPAGLRSIQFSAINTTTHNLNNWITATTSLATSIYSYTQGGNGVAGLAAVQWGRWVYLLGGHDGTQAYHYNTVSFAALDAATGQLGPLTVTKSLPQSLSNGQAVVLNGRIYYMGGIYTSTLKTVDTVYYATPDAATGVITAWFTTTAPLPYKTFGQMAVATVNNRIYSMSGITVTSFNGSVPNVFYAAPTVSGDIADWVEAKPVPQSVYGGAAVSFAGQVYNTGGAWGADIFAASPYVVAGLDVLGTGVTGWVNTSGITPPRLLHTAVVNPDGYLYIIGGSNGANQPIQQNIINIAATTGRAGSAYAPNGDFLAKPFDFGKNFIIHEINWAATVPTSATLAFRYRSALNNGSYTPWSDLYYSPASTEVSTTTLPVLLTGRYLQYQVFFTTTDQYAAPSLSEVNVIAEVPTPPIFEKSADPVSGSRVDTGERVTYTLTYSNVNSYPLTNVSITDLVPTTTTYITGSIFGPAGVITHDLDSAQLSWIINTLPGHSGGTIGFAVTVKNDTPEGTIIYNSADLVSDQANAQSNSTSHFVGLPLELVKSHSSSAPAQALGQVQPGDVVTYTLAYMNSSQVQSALNTVITDSLPLGITYLGKVGSFTPTVSLVNGHQVLRWSIGTVPTETQGAVGFSAQVVTDSTIVPDGGTIANAAFGSADQQPFSSNIDVVPVRYRFDLQLSVNNGMPKAPAGSLLTYTVQLTNVTQVAVTPTNIVVSMSLAPGLPGLTRTHVLDCVAPCAGWNFGGMDVDGNLLYTRTVAALGPNQTTQLTMLALVSPTLPEDVLAVAGYAEGVDDGRHGLELNPANQAGESITIVGGPDIEVTRLNAPVTAAMKKTFTVQVVLQNTGFAITRGPNNTGGWFGVDLYIKPIGSPPPSGPTDRYLGACPTATNPCPDTIRWAQYKAVADPANPNTYLAVGETVTLTYQISVPQAGKYWLYVQADPYWNDPAQNWVGTPEHGRIVEGNEVNNLYGPFEVTVDTGIRKVFLPLIRRN